MSEDQVREFLTGTPAHTGKLATVRPDGRPHLAPIWFLLDDDGSLVFTTFETTVKARNLRHDGRAAICVDDERPPFTFVIVEGAVEITADEAQVRHWTTRLAGRYMGQDKAEEYGRRNGVPGELLVRLRPTRVTSSVNVSD
jgi:PPOX class probable F420-dependent enzyme